MDATTSFPGREGHSGDPVRLGIVTVSDRASRGDYPDEGGPAILAFFQAAIKSPWTALYRCVPDERDDVEAAIIELVDEEGCSVVVTTGGTGLTGRDSTPEAFAAIVEKDIPGFGELFRMLSFEKIGTSTVQSRALAGVAGGTYLFALPGSTSACKDGWDDILRYQLDIRHRPCNFVEIMPRLNESATTRRTR